MDPSKSKYDQGRKLALASIYDTDGLQVILDLMEDECVSSENELIGTHPSDKDVRDALHAIVYAQRKFFQEVVAKLDRMVAEAKSMPVETIEKQREVQRNEEIAQMLSALPQTELYDN